MVEQENQFKGGQESKEILGKSPEFLDENLVSPELPKSKDTLSSESEDKDKQDKLNYYKYGIDVDFDDAVGVWTGTKNPLPIGNDSTYVEKLELLDFEESKHSRVATDNINSNRPQ